MKKNTVPNRYIKRLTACQLDALLVLFRAKGEWVDVEDKPTTKRLVAYGYAKSKREKTSTTQGGSTKLHCITDEGRKRLLDPEKLIKENDDGTAD